MNPNATRKIGEALLDGCQHAIAERVLGRMQGDPQGNAASLEDAAAHIDRLKHVLKDVPPFHDLT